MTRILPDPAPFPAERSCPFDPQDGFAAVREDHPVSRLAYPAGPVGWLVTGFAEARAVLADSRFSARQDLVLAPNVASHVQADPPSPGVFNKMDEPDHSHYRRMLTGRFTVRRIQQFAPVVERIVAEQLDKLEAAGPGADLVELFAEPTGGRVMCEMLGVREVERRLLERKLAIVGDPSTTKADADAAIQPVTALLSRLIRAKTAKPGEDLISDLIKGDAVNTEELFFIVLVMLLGAFDTTPNMLSLGVFLLLERPEHLARLRSEPDLIDQAVEEMLRYLTISQNGATRCALEDVELDGQLIKKGEVVTVALNAANRDPRRFTDPDELNFDRADRGHVGFGHGVHQCIGQNLARSTLKIAYTGLLNRFPNLRLAVDPEEIKMRNEMVHYGVRELPVAW